MSATQRRKAILRISIYEQPRETRFLLEGKLAQQAVLEAERAWGSFAAGSGDKHMVVDLCGVSFVDRAGEQFLEKACAAGAILLGSGPMMRTLIEEIKARAPKPPAPKSTASMLTLMILSLLLATFVIGCALVN